MESCSLLKWGNTTKDPVLASVTTSLLDPQEPHPCIAVTGKIWPMDDLESKAPDTPLCALIPDHCLPLRARCEFSSSTAFTKPQGRGGSQPWFTQPLTPSMPLWMSCSKVRWKSVLSLLCSSALRTKVNYVSCLSPQRKLLREYWLVKRASLSSGWHMKCKDQYFSSFSVSDP